MYDVQGIPSVANRSAGKTVDPQVVGSIRPTGIPALDELLQGGLPQDSTVLLAGEPGTGKTILCMQWLFSGYEQYGESGMYITLTEPVNKAIRNAEKLSFAKKENITPGKVHVEDLRNIMHTLGLDDKKLKFSDIDKIVGALGDLVMSMNVKRIVIDSITAISARFEEKDLIRNFIYHLDALLTPMNVNVIMISEVLGNSYSPYGVEEFIADGIITVGRKVYNNDVVRYLQIVKMRGIDYDSQPTTYRLTSDGILLFPKLRNKLNYSVSENRLSSGIVGLDTMTKGGYIEGSSILVSGSSGTGKTLISGEFITEGLRKGEKCLYISFEESKDQLLRNARAFGWDFETYLNQGLLHIISAEPGQMYIEEHIASLQQEIEAHAPKRLVVDSLSALGNAFSPEILHDFLSRTNEYLKEKLVTTVFTNATATFIGATEISDAHLSTVIDHIIMLRYIEIQSELRHAILVLKMRGSSHDRKMREVVFTEKGIEVVGEFSGFENLLSGSSRKVSESVEEQLHDLFLEQLGPMGDKMFKEQQTKGLTNEGVQKLIKELGNQSVLSTRRKEEFIIRSNQIFGAK